MLTDTQPSRAGSLPQWIALQVAETGWTSTRIAVLKPFNCQTTVWSANKELLWERACSRRGRHIQHQWWL